MASGLGLRGALGRWPARAVGAWLLGGVLLAGGSPRAWADGDSDPWRAAARRAAVPPRAAAGAQPAAWPGAVRRGFERAGLDAAALLELHEGPSGPVAVVGEGLPAALRSAEEWERLRDELSRELRPLLADGQGLDLRVAGPGGGLRRLDALLRWPAPAAGPTLPALPRALGYDPAQRLPFSGALAGRTVVLSPGHGWIWDPDLGRYRTQRGLQEFHGCGECRGQVEDYSNAEIVAYHLLPLLEGAGARVLMVRERDLATAELVVDDQDPAYREEGEGFGQGNSGGGYRDSYRTLAPGAAGRATWALEPARAGRYWVSVRYRAGANRSAQARYTVTCEGGSVDYLLDQRGQDDEWISLGEHWCAPGQGHRIELSHGPDGAGYVIPDAVRLGGGIHAEAGQPRWQMGALHHLPYLGAQGLGDYGDVTIRPYYANQHAADLYVSIHTNANDGNASGFSSYRFNCLRYPQWSIAPPAADCDEPPGSAAFQEGSHAAVLTALRRDWDPSFRDQGMRVANFGELRPLDGIPGLIYELAFHDNLDPLPGLRMSDNQAILDPRWREVVAWGLLRGVVDFLVGPEAPLPPARPQGLRVLPDAAAGLLRGSWQPVAGARGYRVRVAAGGRGFDGGRIVEEPVVELAALPGRVYALRVSAVGDGGEGPASELGVGRLAPVGGLGWAPILLVQGFDRQDAWVQDPDNRFDYLFEHAEAVVAAGDFSFGSAANEALEGIRAADYAALDWLLGEESTEHETFSAEEQEWLRDYLAEGGAVMASGTEIAWDLDLRGSEADRAFLREVFGVALEADDAEVYGLRSLGRGPFADLGDAPLAFDDGSHGTYDANWPDVYAPVAEGAEAVLGYVGAAGAAAVAYGAAGHRALILGAPLETVYPLAARAALVGPALRWLLPAPGGPDPDLGPGDGGAPDLGPGDAGTPDSGPEDLGGGDLGPGDLGGGGGDAERDAGASEDLGSAGDAGTGAPDQGGALDIGAGPQDLDPAPADLGAARQDLGAPSADLSPSGAARPGSGGDDEGGCACRQAPARGGQGARLRLLLAWALGRPRTAPRSGGARP